MRALLLVLSVVVAGPAMAQVAPPAPSTLATDTVHHGPAPMGYFFRSLLIPGWGQALLDRKLTGGLFVAFEGLTIGMAMKTSTELKYLNQADTATATSKRAERQDWIVLLVFNHLFSALEAYVSAHLIDFPKDLHITAIPGRRPGIGFSVGTPF